MTTKKKEKKGMLQPLEEKKQPKKKMMTAQTTVWPQTRPQFLSIWSGVQILYLNWSVKNNGENSINSTHFGIFLDDTEGNTYLLIAFDDKYSPF